MNREGLIAEAADAIARERGYVQGACLDEHYRDARAALAVFEQAHTPTRTVIQITPEAVQREYELRNGVTPTDDEREALARLIDPEAWRDMSPYSAAFYDDPKVQETYEGYFWESVRERREPSLAAADRVLAAGFRRTVQGEPSAEDMGPAANCHLCVGAGGYEGLDGEWVDCSCQRAQGEPTDVQVIYEHGAPEHYCMACDHYHAPGVDCSAINGSGVGYVIDKGWYPSGSQIKPTDAEVSPGAEGRAPWEDAKPGEVWEIARDGIGRGIYLRATYEWRAIWPFSGSTSPASSFDRVTSSRRIWPEAS